MLANNLIIWWIAQVAAVAILVALFLRWRPGFLGGKTIREMTGQALDSREQQIREQLEAAQRSREEAARIREESERDIEKARHQGDEIVARAGHTSEAIQEEMHKRAREEYDRIVAQAKSQIEYERDQAELALRRRAADIVVDAAAQVVEQHLDPTADDRLIEDTLAHLRRVE
jgi:F-type H+-transporting ATPase subunit b